LSYAARNGEILKNDSSVINEADIMDAGISGWAVKDSKDNTIATATKSGEEGKTHHISAVLAGYTDPASGLLTVKDGDTVKIEYPVHDADVIILPVPVKCTEGNAVSASLSASGTGGVVGKINLIGFTL